jgi:hypothetical protein
MRRYKSLIVSGEKGQVFGLFQSNYLIDEARLLGAGRKSPETHPIPGDKNKVLAAEDRQAPHL